MSRKFMSTERLTKYCVFGKVVSLPSLVKIVAEHFNNSPVDSSGFLGACMKESRCQRAITDLRKNNDKDSHGNGLKKKKKKKKDCLTFQVMDRSSLG